MDKEQMIEFLKEYFDAILREMIEAIEKQKIPKDWNGVQLRWYAAAKFAWNCSYSNKTTRKKFESDIVDNNL